MTLTSEKVDVKPVLILGVGNLLLKDEGFGVHVIRRLQEMKLPSHVEVIDGGTGGVDLVYHLEGRKKVIVVDAVKGGETPGTLYRMGKEDIEAMPKIAVSLHDINLVDALNLAEFLGSKPEVVLIGVEPKDIQTGLELSPEIGGCLSRVIGLVMGEVGRATVEDIDRLN